MKQPISIEVLYQLYKEQGAVNTDTRSIQQGEIFFALKGPSFDGNQYAAEALQKGARYAVTDDPTLPDLENILFCQNVLDTLQQLAAYHRQQLNIPVIGITGSNGKTTTKELIHAVLSTTYTTSTTQGNLNNHIGIPLTLLRIPYDAQMAVVEMGANHQREIAGYCTYARPTHGLITNCGKAHLEGFGGVMGIRKGKGELFDYLQATAGHAFVCSDFDYFHDMTADRQMQSISWYGTQAGDETTVVANIVHTEPFLKVAISLPGGEAWQQSTKLVGAYNIYNVLAAVSVGLYFGVAPSAIQQAIEHYQPSNHRSQLLSYQGHQVILDSYNANPSSMLAAIENFATFKGSNKVLMLGAMAELGEDAPAEHAAVVALIRQHNWHSVVLVGAHFEPYAQGYHYFATATEAAQWWQQQSEKGLQLLIKGSRSTGMEKVLGL
jgi:UDP-N-acetylmuramoyl-tripeptide--D-alanyl-D-alanine ligase